MKGLVPRSDLISVLSVPSSVWEIVARPYSARRERVWDTAIDLSPRNLISHVNPAMTSHGNRANDGKIRLAIFLHRDFDSAVVQLMSQDTSRSVRTSHASGSRSIQTEILNFPVDHIRQVSCD